MSNKVKGLLKGLRYISQIFEEEEEPEMQIGCPTDVKHVAHIGWDGPAASSPSWIQQFKDGEAPPNGGGDGGGGDEQNVPKLPDQEKRVSTRSGSTTLEPSPSRRRSDKPKGPRRNTSAADSPARTSTSSNPEAAPSGSKPSRRRKSKTSSKSTPSDAAGTSDPGTGPKSRDRALKSKDTCQSSVLAGSEVDQNALDDTAGRRIRAM